MKSFPNDKQHFCINGPAGALELETTFDADADSVAIVCHPNPTQQGTMNNKVVTTLIKAFQQQHCATVRFNFRGVGQSEGAFANTVGEIEDLRAVLHWVLQVLPEHKVILAGFSFGSYVAANVANQWGDDKLQRLISIAPPVNMYDFYELNNISCPWLVVQGDQDEVVPADKVIAWAHQFPLQLEVMTGVGHFFHGKLIELRECVSSFS
ncbi:MAG: alpha/beta fold hydrolase [Gammaproteobacteria bacterium]|nr:alpha/beta fold hydrolase [Gammaproteobacteria bacterium]MCH9744371.1 alpha/beta fold hydrolase [Gammaproteobacteria bacterium]